MTELIFSKNLYDITLKDLEDYFSDIQEESSLVEFKSGDVKLESIYKEVCAFLNTEGGVLVIGSPKEQKVQLENGSFQTICQGELVPSSFKNKDWLVQKISSNISPMPSGIKVQELLTAGGNYFIVEVAQSVTPPHQCNTGVYYIRLEREAKGAPHGIVEALFFKRQKAKLKVSGNLVKSKNDNGVKVSTIISNLSPHPTEKVSVSIVLFNIESLYPDGTSAGIIGENEFAINYTSEMVLWQGLNITVPFEIIHLSKPFLISVTAWSRDAEMVKSIGVFDPASMEFIEKENDHSENKKGFQYYKERLDSLVS